jgi:hypothetical protein
MFGISFNLSGGTGELLDQAADALCGLPVVNGMIAVPRRIACAAPDDPKEEPLSPKSDCGRFDPDWAHEEADEQRRRRAVEEFKQAQATRKA